MNIPQEAKIKWDSLRQQGDITEIVSESGISRPTITAALDGTDCSMEVFTVIQEFYNKRQAAIDNLIKPQEQPRA